jgi:hypothetical protein
MKARGYDVSNAEYMLESAESAMKENYISISRARINKVKELLNIGP